MYLLTVQLELSVALLMRTKYSAIDWLNLKNSTAAYGGGGISIGNTQISSAISSSIPKTSPKM